MEKEPIVDRCLGCEHVMVGPERGPAHCHIYLMPSSKWRIGRCPMAPFIAKESVGNMKMNPIKASKRNIKI